MKHGVINVCKEAGMTSFQVVFLLRKLTGEKKIGHTGTLDPDATGVLPVCIGKATKLVDFLMDSDKQYRARLRFGIRTDTQDLSGKVLEEMDPVQVKQTLQNPERIRRTFDGFLGEIEQLPPMYSAVKVDGVKLVDAARKGKQIQRKKRPVTVYGFEDFLICGFEAPGQEPEEKAVLDGEPDRPGAFGAAMTVDFTVNCSKGTYIRTLCEDIGKALGVPACMERLVRTRTSGLDLSTARTLSELEDAKKEGRLEELVIPTDQFLTCYPALTVKDSAVRKLVYGNYLSRDEVDPADLSETEKKVFRVYDRAGTFYALYRTDPKDRWLKCEKMFIDEC